MFIQLHTLHLTPYTSYLKSLLIVFFIFFSIKSEAQPYNKTTDLPTLVSDLVRPFSNDSLKVVAIYDWVTSNIRYDNTFRKRLEGDSTLTQEPTYILRSKKAVCIGFSKLFKALCEEAHIPALIIEGFAKSNGYAIDKEEHAWNVVKINDKWYLIDATWGINNALFAKKYCFTPPSIFAETHFPHDPLWQLMDYPLSMECFSQGKNCSQSAFFNLKDSLHIWETLDSSARSLTENQRTLQFNPSNIRALKNMGEFYMNEALIAYQQYFKLKENLKYKKGQASKKEDRIQLLDRAIQRLQEAKVFYQRILPLTKKHSYTDAQINIDIIDENLKIIEEEKAQ